jgi:hypothetical protein
MLLRNRLHTHFGRAFVLSLFASLALVVSLAPLHARAQDDTTTPEKHGRKYKAPPDTSHIEVTVLKGFNKKPIMNAAVVFHPTKDGRDEGNLEMKTDPDGKAVIDVIPTGSKVTIQVIADGFATFAEDYVVKEASRQIVISMLRPRAQVSTYVDNSGKPAELKPGVQDPVRPTPKTKPSAPATPSAGPSTAPATTPPTPGTTPPTSGSGSKPQP